jgi:hypothetical protein
VKVTARHFSSVFVLLFCLPAFSWGPQGHRTTGAVADLLLDEKARAAVIELLRDDLDAHGNASHRTTLASVSVWADEIRSTPADRPSWHYDNIPACGVPGRQTYCRNDACNTGQLQQFSKVLADTNATLRERNEALKWVVHLAGDIHQPLHAEDNADRGGNSVNVALAGIKTRGRRSLHGVWDTEFVRLALALDTATQVPPEIDALSRQASSLAKREGQKDPEAWALESNRLARTVAYDYPEFACGVVPNKIVVLSEDYQDHASAIVRERLLLGGARLAHLLNTALGEPQ